MRILVTGSSGLVGAEVGVNICEDIWQEGGLAEWHVRENRVRVVLNLSASPYHAGKPRLRHDVLARFARRTGTVVCYVNLIGGQDERLCEDEADVRLGADQADDGRLAHAHRALQNVAAARELPERAPGGVGHPVDLLDQAFLLFRGQVGLPDGGDHQRARHQHQEIPPVLDDEKDAHGSQDEKHQAATAEDFEAVAA